MVLPELQDKVVCQYVLFGCGICRMPLLHTAVYKLIVLYCATVWSNL